MINRINYSSVSPSFRVPYTTSQEVKEMFLYVQNAGIVYTKGDYSVHRKDLDSILLCYVFKGKGILNYRDEQFRLEKGSLFIIDCLEEHLYRSDKGNPLRLMFIHCSGPNSRRYTEAILSFHTSLFTLERDSSLKKLMGSVISIITRETQNSEIVCANKLNSIFTKLLLLSKTRFIQRDPVPDFVGNCIDYLEKNYKNQIRLEDLAERFAISKFHFVRQFKRYTGSTPYEYLMSWRLNKAKFHLINTDIPISEIVYLTGFRDHSNFARYFKAHEYTTPNTYRMMHRT